MKFQPRYDLGPVFASRPSLTVVELARSTSFTHRSFVRWMRTGIPDRSADRLAIDLGYSPEQLWPEWYAGTGSAEVVDYVARRQSERASHAATAAEPAPPSHAPAYAPEAVLVAPTPLPARPVDLPQSRGYSDDLVWLQGVAWLQTTDDPPGLPPRKESASCACSTLDDLGRPIAIGFCGPTCERRPA